MPEHAAAYGEPLFGVSGEFTTPEALVAASRMMIDRNLGHVDAYSPVPVPGLVEALRLRRPALGGVALLASLIGGFGFFAMCAYATGYDYRLNVGGRPLVSWPSYVIPSVSIGMLTGTAAVVLTLLFLMRLPRLNHPAFNIDGFDRVTQDRFFLCVEARDDRFDADAVERAFAALSQRPVAVQRVPR